MAQPEHKEIEEYLTNNTIKAYYTLDAKMVKAHFENDDKNAESTAHILLGNSDLPLIIRARACMVLACSDQSDFVEMAEEAVRVAELGHSLCSNPSELTTQLVADAKATLEEARARFSKMQTNAGSTDGPVELADADNPSAFTDLTGNVHATTASTDTDTASTAPSSGQQALPSNKRIPRYKTSPDRMTKPAASLPPLEHTRNDNEAQSLDGLSIAEDGSGSLLNDRGRDIRMRTTDAEETEQNAAEGKNDEDMEMEDK